MADFIDVPIDVTAEQIEEMAKRQVDTVAKKGSKNLITSGAVADVEIDSENILNDAVKKRHLAPDSVDALQVKNGAITEDKIAPGAVTSGKLGQYAVTNDAIAPSAVKENNLGSSAVTTGKIADDAVTEEKIADNSVDYNHLKDMAVTPEKLDREYLKLQGSVASLSGESQFYNYLITGADELSDPLKKICMFSIRSANGWLASVGSGRFYGFYVSPTEFVFTKLNNKYRTFRAVFDNEKIISIVRIDASFTSPDMALASDDIYDGYSIENRINYLIDSAVGDIDTALDNIIAIQNSYIGGAD